MKKTLGTFAAALSLTTLPVSAMAPIDTHTITLPAVPQTPSKTAPQTPSPEVLAQMKALGDASGCAIGENSYYAAIENTFPTSCVGQKFNAIYEGVGADQTVVHAEFPWVPGTDSKPQIDPSYVQIALRNDAATQPFAKTWEQSGDVYVLTRSTDLVAKAAQFKQQMEVFTAAGKVIAARECDVDAQNDTRSNCTDIAPYVNISAAIDFVDHVKAQGGAFVGLLAKGGSIKDFDGDAARQYLTGKRQRFTAETLGQ